MSYLSLQDRYATLLKKVPTENPKEITFMEIAGYAHYENVCSNILKFFFTPNQHLGALNGLLLNTFFKLLNREELSQADYTGISVRREVVTNKGRIDLLIISSGWVLVIENKIRHELNNDLEEYVQFVKAKHPQKELIPVVLSLKNELKNLKAGFKNIMYDELINEINKHAYAFTNTTAPYNLIFEHFIVTLKRLNMPVHMTTEEKVFLKENANEITEIISLNNKLSAYINTRAHTIKEAIKSPGIEDPWVWGGYDVGFHYIAGDTRFKVECLLDLYNNISILICVETNMIDMDELNKLELFKTANKKYLMKPTEENNRIIIKENIDFNIDDSELINELKEIIGLMKIVEPKSNPTS